MTERHSRQGCAPGQRFGTLDRDNVDLLGPWSWSGVRQADAAIFAKSRDTWKCPPAIAAEGFDTLSPQQEAERQAGKAIEDAILRAVQRERFLIEHVAVKAAILGWGVVAVRRQGETLAGAHPLVRPGTIQYRTDLDGRVDPQTGYWFDGVR